jgi:RNA polymerase sigma-70 factor (ECF subfamily)
VQPGIDWSPRLKDPVLQVELQSVLRAAIDQLPDEYRRTFLVHDVEGLSNLEIADALQLKLATVKSPVHRARLFLRSRLADQAGTRDSLAPARGKGEGIGSDD